jgi:hypothetical protein
MNNKIWILILALAIFISIALIWAFNEPESGTEETSEYKEFQYGQVDTDSFREFFKEYFKGDQ